MTRDGREADGTVAHSRGHGVAANADTRYLTTALVLIAGFMLVEVVVALWAHSLALISDAGHLRAGVDTSAAADLMYAVSSPEMFEMLVLRRRWPVPRYASYVEATLTAALLVSR